MSIDETSGSSEREESSRKQDKSKDGIVHGTAEPENKYESPFKDVDPLIPLSLSGASMSDSEQSQGSNESTKGNIRTNKNHQKKNIT